jgi:predicted RNA-binding protein with PIN domain
MKFSVEKQSDPVMQFTMCLLHSVTNAHILHLTTKSYAEHKALESYYTKVDDLVDNFIEAFQGKYGLLHDFTTDYQLPDQSVAYMTYLKDEVATLRRAERFPQDSELQNSVDEIAQLIDSTLYKLRFLK